MTKPKVGKLYYQNANPAADLALFCRIGGATHVLLVRRRNRVTAEPGRWTLPGGFVDTDAPAGEAWRAGHETPRDAAVRELLEETGVDVAAHAERLVHVGDFEGGGRDPRDTELSWVRSSVFALVIDGPPPEPKAADDVGEAGWLPLASVPPLGFDHDVVLRKAIAACGLTG